MVTEFLAALMREGAPIEALKAAKARLLTGQEVVHGERWVSLENLKAMARSNMLCEGPVKEA